MMNKFVCTTVDDFLISCKSKDPLKWLSSEYRRKKIHSYREIPKVGERVAILNIT